MLCAWLRKKRRPIIRWCGLFCCIPWFWGTSSTSTIITPMSVIMILSLPWLLSSWCAFWQLFARFAASLFSVWSFLSSWWLSTLSSTALPSTFTSTIRMMWLKMVLLKRLLLVSPLLMPHKFAVMEGPGGSPLGPFSIYINYILDYLEKCIIIDMQKMNK